MPIWKKSGNLLNDPRIYIYIYKPDSALNNLEWLICDKTKPYQSKPGVGCSELDLQYHHHVVPPAWISLTLSRHFSISFIASGRSSGLHPVSSHSCCMYFLARRPAFTRSYVGVHRSTSLMSTSLLPQQCPACLVRLTWIVFVIGGRWPYS